jgi:hypothetical protein
MRAMDVMQANGINVEVFKQFDLALGQIAPRQRWCSRSLDDCAEDVDEIPER